MFEFSHVSVIPAKSMQFFWTTTPRSSTLLGMDRTLERKRFGREGSRP